MKNVTKLIIVGSLAAFFAIGSASYAAIELSKNETLNANLSVEPGEITSVTKFNKTLEIDKKFLSFSIKENGKVWKSDNVRDDDENLTLERRGMLKNPFIIDYCIENDNIAQLQLFKLYKSKDTLKARFNGKTEVKNLDDGFEITIKYLQGTIKNPTFKLDLTYQLRLTPNGLNFKVIDIKEYECEGKLVNIAVYPLFSASYKQHDGYFLIPDGSGALIDLSKPNSASIPMELYTYYEDMGVSEFLRKPTDSEVLSIPMYGFNNIDQSMFAHVKEGDEYSKLTVKTDGTNKDSYNESYFTFKFRDIYNFYPGVNAEAVPTCQANMNLYLPEIEYELYPEKLEYFELISKYQNYLIESNLLDQSEGLASDLRLEFLMAENKKSMFGREVVKMSDVAFVKEKAQELISKNIKFDVALMGYSKGGLTNSYPNCFPIEGKTGSENDYKNLGEFLLSNDIDYSFIVDFLRSYKESGVNPTKLSMNMSKRYMNVLDYNLGNKTMYNLLTINETERLINEAKNYLNNLNSTGFDFLSLGNLLYSSSYNEIFSRTDAKQKYAGIAENFEKIVGLRKPNIYMFKGLDNYLDASTSNSGFIMETESVPFMSMLLSGQKNLYSRAINLDYIGKEQLLRLIDFNINPTYLVSKESSIELLHTSSDHIFSCKYDDWSKDIIDAYNFVNIKLKDVKNAKFISRTELSEDVYLCEYSNGKKIVVNYNKVPFTYNETTINSLDAEVF